MADFKFSFDGSKFVKMFRDAVSVAFLYVHDEFTELEEICNVMGISMNDDEAEEE